jgi:dienelactone hydrolase
MTEILLFHHALGLTSGVVALADRLRAAGHTVHTPDLYDGETFDSVASGVDHARRIGFGNLVERGAAIASGLPEAIVYAGISMGGMPAQNLAQNRAGARGAVLFETSVPAEEFGAWPAGVPLQIHAMDADPEFVDSGDIDAARALVAAADDGELFL